jgi:putative copper resistance protein D
MLDALVRPLLLIALVTAAAGPWCVVALLRPALVKAGLSPNLVDPIEGRVARIVNTGAWIAVAASLPELYLQTVDISGGSILSGIELSAVWRFLTRTTAGRVWISRILLLAALLVVLRTSPEPARGSCGQPGRTMPRSRSGLSWWTALALAAAALVSRAFASHASAQPSGSVIAIAADSLHILAAASWIGLLIQFRLLLGRLRQLEEVTGEPVLTSIVNRITPIALASAGMLICTGLYNATRQLDSPLSIIASPYGLTLLAKLLLLVPVLTAGALNFLVIRPTLRVSSPSANGPDAQRPTVARRLLSLVEIEASVGAAILALAAVLGAVPPAVDDPGGTLSLGRLLYLFTPRLPPVSSPGLGPGPWPALQQTPDDYAYSVFNHTWAGAALMVMAIGSFLEGLPGRRFRWARAWPIGFVLLAIFLFIRNDPEAWPFGPVGFLESMRIPEMVQHRLSVLLLVALGGVEYLGRSGQVGQSRWAYVFPSLCLFGGFMLFSHSHDIGVSASDTQTYIYVQHAVMGTFALLAGLSRWFQLSRHQEGRWFGRLWPLFVFLLGLQMFLFYKET